MSFSIWFECPCCSNRVLDTYNYKEGIHETWAIHISHGDWYELGIQDLFIRYKDLHLKSIWPPLNHIFNEWIELGMPDRDKAIMNAIKSLYNEQPEAIIRISY